MSFTPFPPFYNNQEYINALASSIKRHLEVFEYDHLLFSYHGVPERHIRKTDPTRSHCKIDNQCCFTQSDAHAFCYRHQCTITTELVAQALEIPKNKYSQSFQSRLGTDKWLEPYTDETFEGLPKKGVKRLAVVTPAFVSDCLETLEEIKMEGEHQFKEAGGELFKAIPCLNDDSEWASVVANWINDWAAKS
jgi:ferrochelatase